MPSQGSVIVRRIIAADAEHLKRARLRALSEAPFAFSTDLGDEASLPDSFWAEKAAESETGTASAIFIALREDASEHAEVGMTGVLPHNDDPGAMRLWGMWVAESARGAGIARRLIDEATEWCRAAGVPRLTLGVFDGPASVPAMRFYERYGFTQVGEARRPRNPARSHLVRDMELEL